MDQSTHNNKNSVELKNFITSLGKKKESALERFFQALLDACENDDDDDDDDVKKEAPTKAASKITLKKSDSILPKPFEKTLDLTSSGDKLATTDFLDQLEKETDIEKILLDDSRINDHVFEKIVNYCPKLRSISLKGCSLSELSKEGIKQGKKLNNVKEICLSENTLLSELLDLVPEVAPNLEFLEIAKVNFNYRSDIIPSDFKFLNKLHYLKHLDLSHSLIDLNFGLILAMGDRAYSLNSLNLENTHLFEEQTSAEPTKDNYAFIRTQAMMLAQFRKLEALNLRGTKAGGVALKYLSKGLPKLKSLIIDGKTFTTIEDLRGFSNLERLDLDGLKFDLSELQSLSSQSKIKQISGLSGAYIKYCDSPVSDEDLKILTSWFPNLELVNDLPIKN